MNGIDESTAPTALEEIQLAILELTKRRQWAEEGPFMFLKYEGDQYDNGDIVMGDPSDPVEAYPVIAQNVNRDDADLILTLHRTIDAQLAVLTSALEWVGSYEKSTVARFSADSPSMQLARAINGVSA